MSNTQLVDRDWSAIPFLRKPWGSLLLFLFCWPAYLVILWTGDLYYRDKGAVRVRSKAFKIGMTLGSLCLAAFYAQSLFGSARTPAAVDAALPLCTDPAVKAKAEQIVRDAAGRNVLQFVVKDLQYLAQLELRHCGYTFMTSMGGSEGIFAISWKDKARGIYLVEF